ncbi:S-methyl-5-thioribose-1-phosphate isomerase [Rhodohalobacter barkolensis]|uniref:Methylthioribose-1-phosphate isomerase n=1 Tax=Rhodohalobacter barkolensis TaxID=2053187 RepID=A0A2N0VLB7_9BACT|nr:S-methyl-5-thioribose-1-phosphate isomerase [Rhodohalobacter barkolensis]PKD44931.1 S-methyl-5-thioribose-1-phosphate isomerase [Rhodohalobacter barkolensis]
MNFKAPFQSITWNDDHITIIDQTYLPEREVYVDLTTEGQVWDAIKKMKVRGAPAIGITGAYGLYLGLRNAPETSFDSFYNEADRISEYLNSARPTAVNLSWALKRLNATIFAVKDKPISEIKQIILDTAKTIHNEDRRLCKSIGENGLDLIPDDARILTHCNTGGLATGEFGTAFSVILHAHHAGKLKQVWVDETRPLLQGSRLTTWELQKAEIPFHLNVDSAAAFLMQQGKVDLVVLGADRITKNGDTANKIGTYSLAVLADAHNIPFYVAAPYSTIDMDLETGSEIEIEQRDADEVTNFGNKQTAPDKVDVYNPAFDVTPNRLITAIITEKGVIKPNYKTNFEKLFS